MKRINELSQTVQKRARELPANIAQLPGSLESERDRFIKNKTGEEQLRSNLSEPLAPWIGYGQQYEEKMKKKILKIAKDQQNIVNGPPEDANFQFDMKVYVKTAEAVLKEDPELSKLRFILVPQHMTESTFWRNYFYRVMLAKQSVLGSIEDEPEHQPASTLTTPSNKGEVLFDLTADDSDEEDNLLAKDKE
ncbi:Synapse-associated protein 1 [Apophysomyces ossiformis]|uniref:Synapse-associated protein 1 n=1 Tax=Apophysomyces ossiformis TaxID=679940 RepID=A0A8H7BJI6_9FUNG|nr:Synapse-associated protein 1 [Apophysomyces ossiformis]